MTPHAHPHEDLPAGAWPVMLTPFTGDGAIDWPAYRELIDFYLAGGSAGLFATCLSSETEFLSADEIVELSRVAVEHAGDRAPVVSGAVVAAGLDGIVSLVKRVAETGPEAVVLAAGTLVPADADEAAWRDACQQVIDRTPGIPLGIYECPWPNHRRLSAETMAWLAGTGRFRFHKDTACVADRVMAKVGAVAGSPMRFYNADVPTLPASQEAGGAGFSGTSCNFAPGLLAAAAEPGGLDDAETASLVARLHTLIPPGYPANAKAFLRSRGLSLTSHCRSGATPQADNLKNLEAFLADLNDWSTRHPGFAVAASPAPA